MVALLTGAAKILAIWGDPDVVVRADGVGAVEGIGSRALDSRSARRRIPRRACNPQSKSYEPEQDRSVQDQEVSRGRGGFAKNRNVTDQRRGCRKSIQHELPNEKRLEDGTVQDPQICREANQHEPRSEPSEHLV